MRIYLAGSRFSGGREKSISAEQKPAYILFLHPSLEDR